MFFKKNTKKYSFTQHQEKKEHHLKNKNLRTQFWLFNFFNRKNVGAGFTLIELLVIITIIGLLATASIISLNNSRIKSRDAKRKADLQTIRKALNMYMDNNGKFPQAGSCAYGSNCYVYSTSGDNWIPALTAGGYLSKVPKDPKNNAAGPWTSGRYSYAYGNVSADGQKFDLTTQLENTSDPERCAVQCYKFYFNNQNWCTGNTGSITCTGSYSTQIYENSPQ